MLVSFLTYETDFNVILCIVIPMFVDFLHSLYAKNDGQLVGNDA